jgi:hypothetical protein
MHGGALLGGSFHIDLEVVQGLIHATMVAIGTRLVHLLHIGLLSVGRDFRDETPL